MDQEIRPKRHKKKLIILISSLIFIILVASGVSIYLVHRSKANQYLPYPLPASTFGLLSYDIYYPDQKLLPPGYTLNTNSFKYSDQSTLYTVTYGNNQTLRFSLQDKPSNNQIQKFYSQALPAHTNLSTKVGQAAIGGVNTGVDKTNNLTSETFVSLPTNTDTWLIVTGPNNTNIQNLKQVISSIRLAK